MAQACATNGTKSCHEWHKGKQLIESVEDNVLYHLGSYLVIEFADELGAAHHEVLS